MSMGTCRGCGAKVKWIKTLAGKNMPCDPTGVPYWENVNGTGKIVLSDGRVVSCDLEGDPVTMSGYGWVSHFSTCPNADRFRRASKARNQ